MAKVTQTESTATHSFSVAMAVKYGMFEAVLINHFMFWLTKNESDDINYHDGRYWSFSKLSSLEALYPYIGRRTLERALQHLVDEKVLMKGNYNDSKLNRTLWYSFTDEFKAQKWEMHFANLTKSCDDNLTNSISPECHNPFRQSDEIKKDISIEIYKQEKDRSSESNKQYRDRFTPPTVDEVEAYCQEMGYGIDPDRFVDYYTANGWMAGKTHMKDWKAAVRNWERSRKEKKNNGKRGGSLLEQIMNA